MEELIQMNLNILMYTWPSSFFFYSSLCLMMNVLITTILLLLLVLMAICMQTQKIKLSSTWVCAFVCALSLSRSFLCGERQPWTSIN